MDGDFLSHTNLTCRKCNHDTWDISTAGLSVKVYKHVPLSWTCVCVDNAVLVTIAL